MSRPRSPREEATAEAFARFLEWLDPDRDRAAEAYRTLHRRLVKLFACRGCEHPEELADETMTRVMYKSATLADDPARNRAGYFYGVARNVIHEHLRTRQRQRLAAASETPETSVESVAEVERRHACLEHCLATELSEEERELILEYHREGRQIARRKGLAQKTLASAAALRKQTQRIRSRLQVCLRHCLGGAS